MLITLNVNLNNGQTVQGECSYMSMMATLRHGDLLILRVDDRRLFVPAHAISSANATSEAELTAAEQHYHAQHKRNAQRIPPL